MDFDDNFNASSMENNKDKRKSTHSDSSSSGESDPDKIVEAVLKGLGQTYRPLYRPMGYQQAPAPSPTMGPYMCGICAKPHKTEQCTSYMPYAKCKSTSYKMLVPSVPMKCYTCYERLCTH